MASIWARLLGLRPKAQSRGRKLWMEELEGRLTPATAHFAAIGDYGSSSAAERVVAEMVHNWNPEFVITMGDNNYTYGNYDTIDNNIGRYYSDFIYPYLPSEYTAAYGTGNVSSAHYYDPTLAGSPTGQNRFFPALGNHDWGGNNSPPQVYLKYFTLPNPAGDGSFSDPGRGDERYYTFVKGPVQFFVLDSNEQADGSTGDTSNSNTGTNGGYDPDGWSSASNQAKWLKSQLAASTATWKVVYFHHPAYNVGSSHGGVNTNSHPMRWPFEQWGADVVMSGHEHSYQYYAGVIESHTDAGYPAPTGIPYIVNGLGGNSANGWSTAAASGQPVPTYALSTTASSTLNAEGDTNAYGGIEFFATDTTFSWQYYAITSTSTTTLTTSAVPRAKGPMVTLEKDNGLPAVSVIAAFNASEPSTAGSFTVSRTGDTSADLIVNYTVSGTATAGGDYQTLSGSVTIPAGSATAAISVTPFDDSTVENTETVIVTLSANASVYNLGSSTTATVNLTDDEPVVSVASASSASEPSTPGAFTISRTGSAVSLALPLVVNFTIGGTATPGAAAGGGNDYQTITGSATIPANAASVDVSVTPFDDAATEGTETVILTLSSSPATYTVGSPSTATVNLLDDEVALPTVTLSVPDSTASEPSSTGRYTFTRSAADVSPLVVNYAVSGTASNGIDYVAFTGSVTIPANATTVSLTVTPIDDNLIESTETVIVTLTSGSGYNVGTTSGLTVNLSDDDTGRTVTVTTGGNASEPSTSGSFIFTRSGATALALPVTYTIAGTATSGTDYTALTGTVTIPAGSTSVAVTVAPIDDSADEGNETVIATVSASSPSTYTVGAASSATVSIIDNDGSTSYLVSLGSSWHYLDDGSNQGTTWRTAPATDTWASGNSELGFGDGGEATTIRSQIGSGFGATYPTTYYFRKTFTVAEVSAVTALTLNLIRDDGAVVYINNSLVASSNMPATFSSSTRASSSVSGTAESTPQTFSIAPSFLINGTNSIAVEVHMNEQSGGFGGGGSRDLSFNLELIATLDTGAPVAPSAPLLIPSSQTGPDPDDNHTYDNTPTFTGIAEANSTVNIYRTGSTSPIGTGTANASGVYTITSSALPDGAYDITATATRPSNGHVSAVSGINPITIDTTPPTGLIVPVSPSPRYVGVSEIAFAFSEEVLLFSRDDLTLTRDGGPNLLTNAQGLLTEDLENYVLTNLSSLTAVPGTYVLTLNAASAGVIDEAANPYTTDLSHTFVVLANSAPTLNGLAPRLLNEDAPSQTVVLTGITAGPNGAGQTLTVTAASGNTALIPNPTVSYASPNSTGSLVFAPVANANGTTTITVTVTDDGGTSGGGVNSISRSFAVTVYPVNDSPMLNSLSPLTIDEDAGAQTVSLSGITAGPPDESSQPLLVTAKSSNTQLIPAPTVTYTSPNSTGVLRFVPTANASGTTTITVTVNDRQGTSNSVTRTFAVTVLPVNDAPTLSSLNPVTLNEDAPTKTIGLTGITAGPGETGQPLTVTALSSNPSVVPNPTVTYTSGSSTGKLTFTPVPNASGAATITVMVDDGQASNQSFTRTFVVTVNPVNDPPTLDPIANVTIDEDAPAQSIDLTGVTAGGGELQTVTVTATSNNSALFSKLTVQPALLTFDLNPNAHGSATITVTVNDGGGSNNTFSRSFAVTVNSVNDAPTLNPINPVTIKEDAAAQTVSLLGITAGDGETQPLTVTAVSSNTGIIPNPTVAYTSPSSTGSLVFAPVANAFGTATITVTVDDGGSENNPTTRTFTVTVQPVNDAPTLSLPTTATVMPSLLVAEQSISLSNISPGPANESSQPLSFAALSSNPALVANPHVTYTSGNTGGTLDFTPAADASGVATITVTGNDGQGTNNTYSRSVVVTVASVFVDGSGWLVVNGSSNDDTITVTENAADFVVHLEPLAVTHTVAKSLVTGSVAIRGLDGNDSIVFNTGSGYTSPMRSSVIRGGSGNDTLVGGNGRDVLVGGAGSDSLLGIVGLSEDPYQFGNTIIGGEPTESELGFQTWTDERLQAMVPGSVDESAFSAALSDSEIDVLLGSLGIDWFWVRGAGESDPSNFQTFGPLLETPWDNLSR